MSRQSLRGVGFSRKTACTRDMRSCTRPRISAPARLARIQTFQEITNTMATARKSTPLAKKTSTAQKAATPVKTAAVKKSATSGAPAPLKPVKDPFTKTTLVTHLATQAGVEPKAAKAVLAALETAILGAVHKKGCGEFTLPGLLKIGLQQVPAKKKRFGKDPFTGEERWFAAKPASVKIKTRALKKLKDATL